MDSVNVTEIIRKHILKDPKGSVSFYEYMDLALYEPHFGYYSSAKKKVGKEGDFYTSSSVGGIFGEILAHVFAEMAQSIPRHRPLFIVEFGGGNGNLMYQVLGEWKNQFSFLFQHVQPVMIEKSPFHVLKQKEKLKDFPVIWADDWQALVRQNGKINGIVFSNELLDAFPVFQVARKQRQWQEIRVVWDEVGGKFAEQMTELEAPSIWEYLRKEEQSIPMIDGYRLEVNLDALKWLAAVAEGLTNGYVLTIDYGFLRDALYIPERRRGTVMCYKNHEGSENPLLLPGEYDITSHINFSSLMDQGVQNGLENLGFMTQSEFLMNAGILERLMNHQESDPFRGEISKRNRAIRQLIFPEGMGRTFKVLIQAKGDTNKKLVCLEKKSWI